MIGDEVAGAWRLLAAHFAQTQVAGSRELEPDGLCPRCPLRLRSGVLACRGRESKALSQACASEFILRRPAPAADRTDGTDENEETSILPVT